MKLAVIIITRFEAATPSPHLLYSHDQAVEESFVMDTPDPVLQELDGPLCCVIQEDKAG